MGKLHQLRTISDLDGRTRAAKATRERIASLRAELGEPLPATVALLVERAALLASVLEDREAAYLAGQPIDLASYSTAANTLRRLLERIDAYRRPVDPRDRTDEAVAIIRAAAGLAA